MRAFIEMQSIPAGHLAHPVEDDNSAPHFRRGEVAIIDLGDREPVQGELFLIEWQGGRRDIAELDQTTTAGGCWLMRSLVRRPSPISRNVQPIWTEGPVKIDYLRQKLVGRVAGILSTTQPNTCPEAMPSTLHLQISRDHNRGPNA